MISRLRRLPGVSVQPREVRPGDALPRMDIAAFVGFAAAGEYHVPTPVHSAEEFTAAFGADVALAWDEQAGEMVHAQLGPAVRSFFSNGGRRCFVIRTPIPDTFGPAPFLHPELAGIGAERLVDAANFIRYQRDTPLQGIHAILGVEEVTLLAAPDAGHRAWAITDLAPAPLPLPAPPLPHPEWWPDAACDRSAIPLAIAPDRSQFLECHLLLIHPPDVRLASDEVRDEDGVMRQLRTLTWSLPRTEPPTAPPELGGPHFTYIVEEAAQPDWRDAATIYSGAEARLPLPSRAPGNYYYRVRATYAGATSDWSSGVVIQIAPPGSSRRIRAGSPASALAPVHQAMLRMCAARGDILAVLSLPKDFRDADARRYAASLRKSVQAGGRDVGSYGALYHPWLIGRAVAARATPPDGAMCGVMARRAIERGAWVAPANEPISGAFAVTPELGRERWGALFDEQLNVVLNEPRGVMSLSALTLAADGDLRQINVRRLLMLLRRLALREGNRYVFEPNSDAFGRLVQRGFEAVLGGMFVRGAFAGRTAADAYRVVTNPGLNPRASLDQGRFIVELRVAPTQPLAFINIRLVRDADRAIVSEGR